MSAEHHGPEAALDRRSALPSIPGIPWWGAIVLAVTATAIGFAYAAQEESALPLEPTDQPLDLVVTEGGVIRPAR